MLDLELRPTWAEIDLDALTHNFREIRKIVGNQVKVLGVVKADAYGHGSVACAKALLAAGADMLAVAFIDEAIALRQNGITSEIMLLGFSPEAVIPELIKFDIIPTVYQHSFALALSDYCRKKGLIHPIHIKVDTGMGRIGFSYREAAEMVGLINELEGVFIQGLFSHFSTADASDKTFTRLQYDRFKEVMAAIVRQGIEIPIYHIANSAAIFDLEGLHLDMVRPGIILYGLYPSAQVERSKIDLKPVMSFKSRIVHLKTIGPGESVSYGNRYVASEEKLIGTLPVGYADGYTRMLSGKAEVFINGQRAPIVGNICMDQCMVDCSGLDEVSLYDEVELFGRNLSADELADKLGTINYEITCLVNKRVPRLYISQGSQIEIKREILKNT
ncbi:alanine racemase [Eubacteriaceae bacterium ES3]|nr:alanine racemase [Eubacteriaceae bacterium ES3]